MRPRRFFSISFHPSRVVDATGVSRERVVIKINPDCSAASFVTFFPVEEKLSKMYRPCLMLVESRFSEGCLVLKSFPCTSAFKKPITINVLGKEQIRFFTKFGKRQQYPFHFHGVDLGGNKLLWFFCSTSFSELKP